MTNWPNIQEYRNFETKFIDDPKRDLLIHSGASNDLESLLKQDKVFNNHSDDIQDNQTFQNSKIVRCIIRKDFEETFKKPERENGIASNQELIRVKPPEPVTERSSDKIRLQNHLKWKKQKEEEYIRKKEAEKIAQRKKREEELRLERIKKQKEKEREEKMREWEEQKAREKEEKKKEKMVMKKLEELKMTPSMDKERLIEEWVKLKNKQKQIEAEKKAQLLKKEEESKALRQNLADLSYKQWKESLKGRMTTLPKNGYQIFGPKPTPVVKEDWNHDFIKDSPRNQNYNLKSSKSNTATVFSFSTGTKNLDNISKDISFLGDLKCKSPVFRLKNIKSGLNLHDSGDARKQYSLPLKELQAGAFDSKKKVVQNFTAENLKAKSDFNFLTNITERDKHLENYLNELLLPTAQGDHTLSFNLTKRPELLNYLSESQVQTNKKKIDLYIKTTPDEEDVPQKKVKKKFSSKNNLAKSQKECGKEFPDKTEISQRNKNERSTTRKCTRSLSLHKFDKKPKESLINEEKKKFVISDVSKAKACRRTQSCDKPFKNMSKSKTKMNLCSSSLTVPRTVSEGSKTAKSKTCCSQMKKPRNPCLYKISGSKSEKKLSEIEQKSKKKIRRKNSLPKSYSFSDSPYCAKNISKSLNKLKTSQRKSSKDIETKSDEDERARKSSKSKMQQG